MKRIAFALLVLILVSPCASSKLTSKQLEIMLIDTLRFDHTKQQRAKNSDEAIAAYVKAGYLNKKPNIRADYVDFYVLKKPATIMGHTVIVIENEYMSEYIGCCASPGVGLLIKTSGSTHKLEKFSKENACTFSNHIDVAKRLKTYSIETKLMPGNYASLSCRERDVPE